MTAALEPSIPLVASQAYGHDAAGAKGLSGQS